MDNIFGLLCEGMDGEVMQASKQLVNLLVQDCNKGYGLNRLPQFIDERIGKAKTIEAVMRMVDTLNSCVQ